MSAEELVLISCFCQCSSVRERRRKKEATDDFSTSCSGEKSPYLSVMTDAMTPAECQTSLRRIHHHPHSGEMSYQGDTTCGISVAFFVTLANSKLFVLPPVLKVCHRNGVQFVCGERFVWRKDEG